MVLVDGELFCALGLGQELGLFVPLLLFLWVCCCVLSLVFYLCSVGCVLGGHLC